MVHTVCMRLTFNGANLFAAHANWSITVDDWSVAEKTNADHFLPIHSFRARFTTTLARAARAGFDGFDVWTGQLDWRWATATHMREAREALDAVDLPAPTYVGWFGDTMEAFERACVTACAIGAKVLSGSTPLLQHHRSDVVRVLRRYGLVLGVENHPGERTPADIERQIGDGQDADVIGTTIDTGWWGTQGFDAADAMLRLAPRTVALHLKDVRAAGAHDTCTLGDGIVPVQRIVHLIQSLEVDIPVSIEHEPAGYDPFAECVQSRDRVLGWFFG